MTSLALIATSDAAYGARALARSDCAAVQMALQTDGNATAVCAAGDKVAVEYALAAGIRKVHELGSTSPAEFQVAYVGAGAAELVGDIYLARWAELSKASLLFDVIRCSEQSEAIRDVECDAGRGARYHLSVRGPIIMVVSSHIARPTYVSRYRRQSAAQGVSRERSSAHGQVAAQMNAHDWNPVRPRVRARRGQNEPSAADDRLNDAFSIRAGTHKDSSNVIVADPETCARHILRYLAHHGFITHATPEDRVEVPEVRQRSTELRIMDSASRPVHTASLDEFMSRRPRQAYDSPTRRARQPRPFEKAKRENDV
jgi:hypothetical protein